MADFGLFNIRERLKLMGGNIDIHSVVGEGTTVRIRVPLKTQHRLFDEAAESVRNACWSKESGPRTISATSST